MEERRGKRVSRENGNVIGGWYKGDKRGGGNDRKKMHKGEEWEVGEGIWR